MTQKEKIKAEIEGLLKCYKNDIQALEKECYTNNVCAKYLTLNAQTKIDVCRQILSFINSLQAETVSEEFELAAERYACRYADSKYGHDKIKTAFKAGANWQEVQDNICYEEIFEEGANWQKEQMLAKAVDGEVGYWNIRGLSINMELPSKLEEGNKVKLIIIKED